MSAAERMSVLPISMKRPPRGSSLSEASMNSPLRLLSTTSMPCPPVASIERRDEIQGARGSDLCGGHSQALQDGVFAGVGGGEDLAHPGDGRSGWRPARPRRRRRGSGPAALQIAAPTRPRRCRRSKTPPEPTPPSKRPSRRDGHDRTVIGDGGGREGVGEHAHHRITRAHRCHIGGGLDDHPGRFCRRVLHRR